MPYLSERPRKKLHPPKHNLPLAPVLTQAAIQSSNLCPVVGQRFKLERDDVKTPKHEYGSTHSGNPYAFNATPYDSHGPRSYSDGSYSDVHRSGFRQEDDNERTSLYIRNLPHEVDELRLYELFGHFGGIRSVKRLPDRDGRSRGGVGFVNFVDYNDAARATAEMNNFTIDDHVLIISLQARPVYHR